MPIKQVFDTQEAVPEFLKTAVVEQDGKWVFEAETSGEIRNLKETLRKERDDRTKFQGELKKFERFKEVKDEDWESFQDYLQTRHEEEIVDDKGKKPSNAAELEKAIAREKQRFQRQIGEKDGDIKTRDEKIVGLERQIREFTIWTPVHELAVKYQAAEASFDSFLKVLRSDGRFDLDETGKLVFKDADGYPTTMKMEEAWKQLQIEFPWAFKASNAAGSGANNNTAGLPRGIDLSKLTASERLKAARQAGLKE